jgi:integrase
MMWAVEQKMLPACPKVPAIKVPKKRPQPVPTESFEKLLEKASDPQTRAYLLAGWLGGLRLREALALEREPTDKAPWIDLERDRIVFPAEFLKAVEDQWVPLDPVLREAFEALPSHGPKVFKFVSTRTGQPICAEGLSQRVVMDYYSNVDEAVEAAVLGSKRNSSRQDGRTVGIGFRDEWRNLLPGSYFVTVTSSGSPQ